MRFRIRRGGVTIAFAGDESESLYYADQYRDEGEITIQYHTGTHWKRFALFCQWPVIEEGPTP